jgi:hypothetical protein
MRLIGIGLAVVMAVGVLAPATVMSASKKGASISEAARKQGMAEAPAIVQQAGSSCQVTDARFIGKAEDKKAKSTVTYYEVDCATGPGYVVQGSSAAPPVLFNCFEANTPAQGQKEATTPCILPGNADPKADLAPLIAKAGIQCTPTQARSIGRGKTNQFLELACQEGPGYVLVTNDNADPAKEVQAENCLSFDDQAGAIKCTLSDAKTRLAVVDRYVAEAKNNCQVKERRYIGMSTGGSTFFETSCEDGKGYIYKVAKTGALEQAYGCAQAANILGGCKLTDARQAASDQAELYTRFAKNAGVTCDVDKYALFQAQAGKEVVELVCKNGPGGVGIFDASGKGQVLDCGHALVAGYQCGLNTGGNPYAALTADLKKFDKASCVVSKARAAGKTAKGTIFVEVACADGLKGYMIEYKENPVTAVGASSCAFTGGCTLPGNT